MLSFSATVRARRPSPLARPARSRLFRAGAKFGAIAALILTTVSLVPAPANAQQSFNVYIQPVFLYRFLSVQDCGGCNDSPGPWYSGPSGASQAYAYAQSDINGTRDNTTYTLYGLNAPSGDIYIDGNPFTYDFSVQVCQENGSCNDNPNTGYIQLETPCPAGWSEGDFAYTGTTQLDLCFRAIYNILPCPYCLGDPVYPATGQNVEPETDYQGPSGLTFTRTYRSNNGQFTSIATQAFANNSGPAGTVGERCYTGTWTESGQSGGYCFPYTSAYPDTGSVAQYQLQTDDGRTLLFTGPNSAITQNADINDRVTLITVGGAAEWQVHRDDDSIEIYDAGGSLIQKTLRGGQTFTYTYSTTSTPSGVERWPRFFGQV